MGMVLDFRLSCASANPGIEPLREEREWNAIEAFTAYMSNFCLGRLWIKDQSLAGVGAQPRSGYTWNGTISDAFEALLMSPPHAQLTLEP